MTLYNHGFARVAAVGLPVALADPAANADYIVEAAQYCHDSGVAVAVFPELCLTGYSIDDLVLQDTLLAAVNQAIGKICEQTRDCFPLLIVGAPLEIGQGLYNCALFIHRGEVVAVTPKAHLASYREFYEKRHFSTSPRTPWNGVPTGTVVLEASDIPGLSISAEICEDLWVPVPPSSRAALAGATVIANLSASPVTIGRAQNRTDMVRAQSTSTCSAYIYAAAGFGESSNDLAWDGQSLIYQSGTALAASERFQTGFQFTTADVDLDALRFQRRQQNSFVDNATNTNLDDIHTITIDFGMPPEVDLDANIPKFPFVPSDPDRLHEDCYEAFNIQVAALVRRMTSVGAPNLIIGVSGGLDSTQALLVCAEAVDKMDLPRSSILAYTMPGFGTSSRTRQNAEALAKALGTTFEELDIRPTAELMLETMGHAADNYDVTFENIQAGLRTDYLFRLANQKGGFVVGTGDLSELALGWCTYGVGDQMSHYGVNAGLPKTMIQHLIRWVGEHRTPELRAVLDDILDTEISPELVPGKALQSTQAVIGPYELQDFTLYHLLKNGFGPAKIFYLASHAWPEYSEAELIKWLRVFHRRFFANQFKRAAVPNGPKLMGGGSLSPRGDWRMPSDAASSRWMAEIAMLEAEE